MKEFKKTAIAAGVAQVMLLASGAVFAQSGTTPTDKDKDANTATVIVAAR
ncbi:MAG: hypothetical protein V4641_24600 [Pseudomonadota bacterium]